MGVTMTDQYAVFGNPIAQSKSPEIHRAFAVQTVQAMEYKRQLVDLHNFTPAADSFFQAGGKGLNITVPFKQVTTPRDQPRGYRSRPMQ